MGNKQDEIDCLNRVIEYGKSLHGKSKSIINLLLGEDVPRKVDDHPDFIKRVYNKDGTSTLVGIEHFQVDAFSIVKDDGKVCGTSVKYSKDIRNIYDNYSSKISDCALSVKEQAVMDIGSVIKNRAFYTFNSSYRKFLFNFEYSLNKHLNRIDNYLYNINQFVKENETQKMILLIEVRAEFKDLFYNRGKTVKKKNDTNMPLFRDVVELLKLADSDKIDYLVLCCGNSLMNGKINVFAFETKNVEKSIKKTGAVIYDYYGEDAFINHRLNIADNIELNNEYKFDDKNYDININYSANELTPESKLKLAMFPFHCAYLAKHNNKDFITTTYIFSLLFFLEGNIKGWTRNENDDWWEIKPILKKELDKETYDRLSKEFEDKWFPEKGEINE